MVQSSQTQDASKIAVDILSTVYDSNIMLIATFLLLLLTTQTAYLTVLYHGLVIIISSISFCKVK